MVLTNKLPFGNVRYMEKLLLYLNNLSKEKRIVFCVGCETTEGYLRKAVSVNQTLGAVICVAIEKFSFKKITRKDLRPDDWRLIWPELAEPTPKEKVC